MVTFFQESNQESNQEIKIIKYYLILQKKRVIIYLLSLGMINLKRVEIFTDGACSGNPGPGGWGCILRYGEYEKEMSGGEPKTTNNRMELTAVIEALSALKEPCIVELYTDSKYVCDSINLGWAMGWKKRGWVKSNKEPALNSDLWETLLNLLEKHKVNLNWIKGHAGYSENERCDNLAVEAGKKYKL